MCLHYDDNYSTPEAGSVLLPSGINGGSMLYLNQEYDDPFQYDLKFKETCCGLAQQCRSYYTRRPYDDCTNYLPPVRSTFCILFYL